MRTLLPCIVLLAASPAAANCTTTRLGNNTFYQCDDGRSGSSTTIGNSTFYNGNDGSFGSSTRIGKDEFYYQATPPKSERLPSGEAYDANRSQPWRREQ
jgi:hypothetical protein